MNPDQRPTPTSPFDPARLSAFAAGQATLAELVGMPAAHVSKLCDRGERLLAAGAAERAATVLRGVVALAPYDARAHALLGVALMKHQVLDAAEVHLRRALEIRQNADDVRVELAELLLLSKRKPEALQLLHGVVANPAARATPPGHRATRLLADLLGVTVPARAGGPRPPPRHHLRQGLSPAGAPVASASPAPRPRPLATHPVSAPRFPAGAGRGSGR